MFFIKRGSRGFLSFALIIALVFTLTPYTGFLPAGSSYASSQIGISDAAQFQSELDKISEGGSAVFRLEKDIDLDGSPLAGKTGSCLLNVGNSKDISILFDGHSITGSLKDKLINIGKGSNFRFEDEGSITNFADTGSVFTSTGYLKRDDDLIFRYYSDTEKKERVTARSDARIVSAYKAVKVTWKPSAGGSVVDDSGNLFAEGGKTRSVRIASGENIIYKAMPYTGRYISAITVGGKSRDVNYKSGQKIAVKNVAENTAVNVTFVKYKYKITSSKTTLKGGNGGSITASCFVKYGNNKTFNIKPKFGYDVKKVFVDGKSVGRKLSYTFKNVTKKHTIKAVFKKVDALKIMLDAGHVGYYNRYVGKFNGGYYYESQMSWRLHNFLKNYLLKYNNVIVDTTRTSMWRDLDVYYRGYKAKGYDLFLSLHSNSSESSATDYPLVIRQLSANTSEKNLAMKLSNNIGNTMGCRQSPSVWTRYYYEGGRKVDYYGVLRGAQAAGCNGYILEHSFHTNKKMALWLYKKDNLKKMAKREAAIIAKHYGLTKKDGSDTSGGTTTDTSISKTVPFRAKITADSVNVRKKAGNSYAKLGTLKKGGVYTIVKLSSSGNWGKLSCKNSGWFYLKGKVKKVSATADVKNYKIRKCVKENLNIRKGPGTGYGTVGQITSNSKVYTIETEAKNGYWGKIKDKKQWICLDYVKRIY